MSRSWELVKGRKAGQITGAQIEQIGGPSFMEAENKRALVDFQQMTTIPKALSFTGGVPWPDSMQVVEWSATASSTVTLKPSDIYSESNADQYLCALYALSITGVADTTTIQLSLADVSATMILVSRADYTTAGSAIIFDQPIYFTETLYLSATEAGGNAGLIVPMTGIISRGGNPQ